MGSGKFRRFWRLKLALCVLAVLLGIIRTFQRPPSPGTQYTVEEAFALPSQNQLPTPQHSSLTDLPISVTVHLGGRGLDGYWHRQAPSLQRQQYGVVGHVLPGGQSETG